ncbi:MAG: hypothetical protein ACKPGB_24525 [Dolichospermum sp.]
MKQTKKRKQLVPGKKWTPKQIPTVMWFDAADSSKITTVSQWNDKSGNGRHLSQTTAENQPIYNGTVSKWRNKSRCRFLYFLSQLIEKVKTWVHYLLKL